MARTPDFVRKEFRLTPEHSRNIDELHVEINRRHPQVELNRSEVVQLAIELLPVLVAGCSFSEVSSAVGFRDLILEKVSLAFPTGNKLEKT